MANQLQQGKKRAAIHSLGCRLNQYEANVIRDKLIQAGYDIVSFDDPADLAIINTCTVARLADSKCRQSIRSFIKNNPNAYTAVVGCYSQMGTKEIASIKGVDLIIGNQDKLNVLDYIGNAEKNDVPVIVRDKIDKEDFSITFVGDLPFNQRANLKIQDGCDFMCSFCRIPFARGRARSRDFNNLMEEANSLVSRGVRELVLTGVNIGTYESQGNNILHVIEALNSIPQLDRVRISSIEPTTIPLELFDFMADPAHTLMPYLHIPLQAGSDKILKLMRRKYSLQEFVDFINLANNRVPDLCIGTDVLVGFPEEDDEAFQSTCDTFLNNPFSYCHVFTYSEREETLAAKRNNHVPMPIRHQRSAHLRRLSAKKRHEYYSTHLGQTHKVLFENPKEGAWPGYTENYIRIVAQSTEDLANKLCTVRLDSIQADYIEGTVLSILE